MIAKTKQWESYVDDVGRRHWRWPAAPQPAAASAAPPGNPGATASVPQPRARLLPLRVRGR